MGAAVALGISGISSAYISEQAERKKQLRELEDAMIRDLSESTHEKSSKTIPIFVAVVNGASPFIISVITLAPLFISQKYDFIVFDPLLISIITAFTLIYFLGVYLGKISNTFWLWSGLRTLLIALVTTMVIYFIS
jgi:predicted membrane protein (TIGR00267 family)